MNGKVVKIIGLAASVLGIGATLIGDWVKEQKQEDVITKKVAEAIAKVKKES